MKVEEKLEKKLAEGENFSKTSHLNIEHWKILLLAESSSSATLEVSLFERYQDNGEQDKGTGRNSLQSSCFSTAP